MKLTNMQKLQCYMVNSKNFELWPEDRDILVKKGVFRNKSCISSTLNDLRIAGYAKRYEADGASWWRLLPAGVDASRALYGCNMEWHEVPQPQPQSQPQEETSILSYEEAVSIAISNVVKAVSLVASILKSSCIG